GRASPSRRGRWMIAAGVSAAAALVAGAVVLLLLRMNPMSTLTADELRARMAMATDGYACAALSYSLAPDRSARLSGHVSTQEDFDRLRRETAAIPGIASLDFAVHLMP